MSKKPNLLRDALKNMRVNAPSFKAPIETQKEAPRNEVPLSQLTPSGFPRSEVPKNEVAQNGVPHSRAPQKKLPPLEGTQPKVSHIQAPQKEVAENKESQAEVPQFEAPQNKESDSAFFRLSHRAFSDPKLQAMSGDCFRLFLWLASRAWRYPNSDGKVRAAIRFIEEGTGMSHANVSRCLKSLKDLELIRVVQTDFKQGNIWWVSPLACPNGGGGGGGKGFPKKEAPQVESAQDRNGATSKRVGGSLKKNTEVPLFEGEIKKLRSIKKIKEVAIADFKMPTDDDDTFFGNSQEILTAFEAAFADDEQSKLVTEFMAREYAHGFTPPMRVVRSLTAMAWYRNPSSIQAVVC
jgi:hypothetical protein